MLVELLGKPHSGSADPQWNSIAQIPEIMPQLRYRDAGGIEVSIQMKILFPHFRSKNVPKWKEMDLCLAQVDLLLEFQVYDPRHLWMIPGNKTP